MGTEATGTELRAAFHAIRIPMLRWWLRTGIWVALGMLGLVAWLQLSDSFHLETSFGVFERLPIGYLFLLLISGGAMALWLWAAAVCDKTLCSSAELYGVGCDSASRPATSIRFAVCFSQGVIPVLLYPLCKFLNNCLFHITTDDGTFSFWTIFSWSYVDKITSVVRELSSGAIVGIWLIGLLVLLPLGRRIAWELLLAGMTGTILMLASLFIIEYYEVGEIWSNQSIWFADATWNWLISGVVLGGMVFCLSTGRYLLGHVGRWILIIPMLTTGAISVLHTYGVVFLGGYVLRAFIAVGNLYSSPPRVLLGLERDIYMRWPLRQPLLYPTLQWLDAFVYILWVVILFTAMYYFLKWVHERNVNVTNQRAQVTQPE